MFRNRAKIGIENLKFLINLENNNNRVVFPMISTNSHGIRPKYSSARNFSHTIRCCEPVRGNTRGNNEPTEEEYVKRYAAGDPDQLLHMYHPDAVVVHVGMFAKHQHEAIKEVLKKWITERPKVEFEEKTIRRFSAGNGDYLFSVGVLTLNFPNGKQVKENYESIYKLHEGRYLLYYDRAAYAV